MLTQRTQTHQHNEFTVFSSVFMFPCMHFLIKDTLYLFMSVHQSHSEIFF